jgi:hypothetical protein
VAVRAHPVKSMGDDVVSVKEPTNTPPTNQTEVEWLRDGSSKTLSTRICNAMGRIKEDD